MVTKSRGRIGVCSEAWWWELLLREALQGGNLAASGDATQGLWGRHEKEVLVR